jgi:hypothetical protein
MGEAVAGRCVQGHQTDLPNDFSRSKISSPRQKATSGTYMPGYSLPLLPRLELL